MIIRSGNAPGAARVALMTCTSLAALLTSSGGAKAQSPCRTWYGVDIVSTSCAPSPAPANSPIPPPGPPPSPTHHHSGDGDDTGSKGPGSISVDGASGPATQITQIATGRSSNQLVTLNGDTFTNDTINIAVGKSAVLNANGQAIAPGGTINQSNSSTNVTRTGTGAEGSDQDSSGGQNSSRDRHRSGDRYSPGDGYGAGDRDGNGQQHNWTPGLNAPLKANDGASIAKGLTVTGGANITGSVIADSGLQSNGQVQVGTAGKGVTLNTNGSATFDGLVTLNGGYAVNGPVTVTGGETVTGSQRVTGQSFLTGGATVSNNLTVTGPGNGGAPTSIDLGGNTLHDVGTPIFGTDAANKAYVDRSVNRAFEGTALALAISQPVFSPGQDFAIRGGWGSYESQSAFGVSAAGVIARNVFGHGSTIVLDGGIGIGTNYNGVAGKAGVTFGFGGGPSPIVEAGLRP